ncbi:MAG: hypothetical protein H6652_25810 [Ardenticatenaceae bacterium]|nr:hypothetical protein [Ardenticatenaceae bacterium]
MAHDHLIGSGLVTMQMRRCGSGRLTAVPANCLFLAGQSSVRRLWWWNGR